MFDAYFRKLVMPAETKIVLLVLDGLGGLPREPSGKTELESARTPNMDALAAKSALGLTVPVGPGITVGSGPGHLALFGYDPLEHEIGRGALEALGVDFELGPDDVAARGNFCTVDEKGIITDRRAGRLPTEASQELVNLLRTINIEGVEFFIEPVREHRLAFVMRAADLGADLSDSDPQVNGAAPMKVRALRPGSETAAGYLNEFIERARGLLAGKSPANMITLRGFDQLPKLPTYPEIFKLRAAAIAVNGMYRGVARLAGMELLPLEGKALADEFAALEKSWDGYDFFYLHYKKPDLCGESGDFDGKVAAIEEFDAAIPRLMALDPDVVIVGGDHSTPAVMMAHSWHPVPVMLYARHVRADGIAEFGERACLRGSLGLLPAKQIMPLALANAGRVAKIGG